jgi:RES domain
MAKLAWFRASSGIKRGRGTPCSTSVILPTSKAAITGRAKPAPGTPPPSERGAWAELFRHWGQDEVSPFEVRRRVGRVRVEDLRVLDLTDPEVRERLDVAVDDVVGDDWVVAKSLADRARELGFEGVLAPSGALPGELTLVVFAHAMHKVTAEHSRTHSPPIRMVDVLNRIRLPEHPAEGVERLYEALRLLARRLGRR